MLELRMLGFSMSERCGTTRKCAYGAALIAGMILNPPARNESEL
jgi:hypothetical protein